ncbi:hypothetical protein IG631_06169 [Alternaria alternata]|nr:hypothetical protein IG631_06169 [Alternaria alternata]
MLEENFVPSLAQLLAPEAFGTILEAPFKVLYYVGVMKCFEEHGSGGKPLRAYPQGHTIHQYSGSRQSPCKPA